LRRAFLILAFLALDLPAGAAEDIDVRISESHPVEDGQWSYAVTRSADSWSCGKSNQLRCVAQGVTIDNLSGHTLECTLHVDYKMPDGNVLQSFDTPALVLPHEKSSVHRRITYAEPQAEVRSLSCIARPPYQRLPKNAQCNYQMHGDPLETYYPESALRRSLEGPVVVAFSLVTTSGGASDVRVAESSLVPELDAAAIRFIQAQRFNTNCPGTSFDLRVRFRLRDQLLAGVN
jgi:TonB family protein